MNLADYRETYYTFSGKASDISRQLSLAGIAVVWIFKAEKGGPLAVPSELHLPALLLVAALALDLLQYVLSAAIWGSFSRYHEWNGTKEDAELGAPSYFNWPCLACFWGKLVLVLISYAVLFEYIFSAKTSA